MSGKRGVGMYKTGDIDAGVWSLGLVAGLIHDIPTHEVLAKTIKRDAENIIARTNGLIQSQARL